MYRRVNSYRHFGGNWSSPSSWWERALKMYAAGVSKNIGKHS